MSEQEQQQINITSVLDTFQIQSSAYVSSQILRSSSISTKKLLNEEQEEEEEKGHHYEGTMERFFQSEVRPISFGN